MHRLHGVPRPRTVLPTSLGTARRKVEIKARPRADPSINIAYQFMAEQNPLDIPLDLQTGWYTDVDAEDYQIPYFKSNPTVAYVNNRIETATSGSTIAFIRVTFACLRYANLSRTFIQIQWTPTKPPTSKQKHFAPPVPMGAADLLRYSQLYGPKVVAFCQSQSHKVGDG